MTAVQWLIDRIDISNPFMISDDDMKKALEKEKQQLIDAYLKDRPKATIDKVLIYLDKAEEYYNKTYKS